MCGCKNYSEYLSRLYFKRCMKTFINRNQEPSTLWFLLTYFVLPNQGTRVSADSRLPLSICVKAKPSVFDGTGVAHLIIVDELFLHHFHGVDALCFLQLHQQHLCVAASSNHPQQLKVCQTQAGGRFPSFPTSPRLGGVGRGAINRIKCQEIFKKKNFEADFLWESCNLNTICF